MVVLVLRCLALGMAMLDLYEAAANALSGGNGMATKQAETIEGLTEWLKETGIHVYIDVLSYVRDRRPDVSEADLRETAVFVIEVAHRIATIAHEEVAPREGGTH